MNIELFFVYIKTKEVTFVKEFNNFHDAITYTSRYQELDPKADVLLLVPFE